MQLEHLETDRESQLILLRKELLGQTEQLDRCQARVSTRTEPVLNHKIILVIVTIELFSFNKNIFPPF